MTAATAEAITYAMSGALATAFVIAVVSDVMKIRRRAICRAKAMAKLAGYRKNGTWREIVQPVADKARLAGKLGMAYQSNGASALALGDLLYDMADRIDAEIERQATQ